MKKTLCFYFQVHQPFRLRRYRFFDMGGSHQYFDEFNNRSAMRQVAERCYIPMNRLLLQLINQLGKQFKVAFSISGQTIEQMELYAPDALDSFKQLAATGCVEFLGETYAHSLSFLTDELEFERQVELHSKLIKKHFGKKPTTFRLTELIYSDEIGAKVADMGFTAMLTEGAKHVMGWKSANYVYTNSINSRLKILLRNFRLSEDISIRFSDRTSAAYPVTSEKFAGWLKALDTKEEIVNIFMNYETFGERQRHETGIFEFMRYLPEQILLTTDFEFLTPAEAAKKHQPMAPIHVPFAISWADEERDLSAWIGNELQDDAFNSLYKYTNIIAELNDDELTADWRRLQDSDHFYYMCTKWFSGNVPQKPHNPYANPYDAYINYMNVLSDFVMRVDKLAVAKAKLKGKTYTPPALVGGAGEVLGKKEKSVDMAKKSTPIVADSAKLKAKPKVAGKTATTAKPGTKKATAQKTVAPKDVTSSTKNINSKKTSTLKK